MTEVMRVVHCRANSGRESDFEHLIKAMLKESSRFSGYRSSAVIPPRQPGEEFHVIQKFALRADLDRWAASEEARRWQEKIAEVSDHPPEFRTFDDPDLWLSDRSTAPYKQAPRWKMAIVTWLAIFPTASLFLWLLTPPLVGVPFLPRMAIITLLVVGTMSYFAMPRMLRWMRWWLHH